MPAKRRQSLPAPESIQDLLDEMVPVPALSESEVDAIDAMVNAPADQFQKALSPAFRKLVVEGLRSLPAPKTLKDLTAVYNIFEKIEGLNKKDDKTITIGLVNPLRNVTRKTVDVNSQAAGEALVPASGASVSDDPRNAATGAPDAAIDASDPAIDDPGFDDPGFEV